VLLRIQEGKNYPENFHLLKCWMFFSEGWRLLLWLGRPVWRPWDK
jgi:hypothetical protein